MHILQLREGNEQTLRPHGRLVDAITGRLSAKRIHVYMCMNVLYDVGAVLVSHRAEISFPINSSLHMYGV